MHIKVSAALKAHAEKNNLTKIVDIYHSIKEDIIARMLVVPANRIGTTYSETATEIHKRYRYAVNDWIRDSGQAFLNIREIQDDNLLKNMSADLVMVYINITSDRMTESSVKHRGVWTEVENAIST